MAILRLKTFRDALFDHLNAQPGLAGKVYKHPPSGNMAPHLLLGKLTRRQGEVIGDSFEVTQSLEFYDEAENTENIDNMTDLVDGILASLTVTGWSSVVLIEASIDDSDFQEGARPYTIMTTRWFIDNQ